jgi:hypothetical protein
LPGRDTHLPRTNIFEHHHVRFKTLR